MRRFLTLLILLFLASQQTHAQQSNQSIPVSSSGNGVGSGAAPIMGWYLGTQCPTANTSQCYNTPANTQQAVDCGWTSGSQVVGCGSSHFTAADIGKRVFGYITCDAFTSTMNTDAASQAITAGTQLTILAQSGTGLTLSANAANTHAGNTGCLIWGTPDDTAAAAIDTAMQSATQCPILHLAAGYYMFTDPHFFTNPTACLAEGTIHPGIGGSFGNVFYAAGFEISGRGVGNTIIYLTPGFPENSTCNHGYNGSVADACFVRTLEGRWSDFQITGGQNALANSPAGNIVLVGVYGPGSIDNWTCTNWGPGQAQFRTYGMKVTGWEQWYQLNNSGCGSIGIDILSSTASLVTGIKVRVENSPYGLAVEGPNTNTLAAFTCYDCAFYNPQVQNSGLGASPPGTGILNKGGNILLYHNDFSSSIGSVKNLGIWNTVAGGQIRIQNSTFRISAGAATSGSILCDAACDVYAQNNNFTALGSGNTYKDVANSRFFDQGGNSFIGGTVNLSGTAFQSASATGTASSTANWATTSGWGTTSKNSAVGDSHRTVVSLTTTVSGSASPVLTWTFPTPYPLAAPSSCAVIQTGGTFGTLTNPVPSSLTTTSVAFTFSGTPTATQTYIFDVSCGP